MIQVTRQPPNATPLTAKKMVQGGPSPFVAGAASLDPASDVVLRSQLVVERQRGGHSHQKRCSSDHQQKKRVMGSPRRTEIHHVNEAVPSLSFFFLFLMGPLTARSDIVFRKERKEGIIFLPIDIILLLSPSSNCLALLLQSRR